MRRNVTVVVIKALVGLAPHPGASGMNQQSAERLRVELCGCGRAFRNRVNGTTNPKLFPLFLFLFFLLLLMRA